MKKGYNISAAVMNKEGRLTAFARNPMASPMTSEIAQGKAYTAALTQASTTNLREIDALAYADGVVPIRRPNPRWTPFQRRWTFSWRNRSFRRRFGH